MAGGGGGREGDTIIFIDSDLVVTEKFLQAHADALVQGQQQLGSDRVFTYGWVINTNNFDNPSSEPYKITDFSAAYFATGNVAIARKWLEEALYNKITGFRQLRLVQTP